MDNSMRIVEVILTVILLVPIGGCEVKYQVIHVRDEYCFFVTIDRLAMRKLGIILTIVKNCNACITFDSPIFTPVGLAYETKVGSVGTGMDKQQDI